MSAVRAARKPVERCVRCGRVFPTRKLKKEHMQQCAELIPFGEEEVLDEVGMGQQLQQQQQQGKQVKAYAYVLPAGAEEIRDDINHSFVCANRTDGFYVDVDNDCQVSEWPPLWVGRFIAID
ncbi:hypothetical protein pipiens_001308 [Culex pipiens pipiens]|uniref:C2H2-type domain-containing protein n=1 Tax=Culex pipiens pipiens TaxID=38569 RepID=A0ABD1D303_CULPP